jgi:plasmid stabilization system protein ParE
MSYRLIVRPEAEADIRNAFFRFENEVPGLGIQFLDAVDDGLDRISEGPLHYAIIAGGIRRKLLRKFPFGLFFVYEEEEIRVLSVLQQAQSPELWKRSR